jgi:hypothetical protein
VGKKGDVLTYHVDTTTFKHIIMRIDYISGEARITMYVEILKVGTERVSQIYILLHIRGLCVFGFDG